MGTVAAVAAAFAQKLILLTHYKGHLQTIFGADNVIVMLGGGGGRDVKIIKYAMCSSSRPWLNVA